ncbi:hypothetical protein BG011_009243 [Mortierella polycephala]|uniref:NTF2-domain-containing protein n=1 Tax=Mortierella polycephala TaxID=41804 RepID=A0A9P6U7S2_9FUNG|nr:hypothetical protein BG011_009243 [Mortierella polycephala]
MAANTANATAPTAPANDEAAVNFHEVGMMFVHEYYTFLNKDPSRLHCFYNKLSTMSHGIQGEETQTCHGQQASAVVGLMVVSIHAKILDLDFEDCKVLVRNVDSQNSLNGGIMIQVLGEMSNKGGPSQKFVQTFFLAVQPKGYFVLNDILRYLKDDPEAEVEAEEYEAELLPETKNEADVFVMADVPPEVAVEDVAVEEVAPVVEAPAVEAVKPVEATKVENAEEKKPATEEKKSTEKKSDYKRHDRKSEKKEKDSKKDARKEVERVEKSHAPEPSKKQTESAAVTQDQTVSTPAPAAAETVTASIPAEPSKPKTWASTVANTVPNTVAKNPNPWALNPPSAKAVSINVPQATPKPQPQSQPQGQSKFQERKPTGREEHHSIYIKNVTEKMTAEQLREAFATFGPIKSLELVHKRYCAYVDFGTVEAMQAALKQNRVSVGSETVLAEERRRPGPQSGSRPFHYQNTNGGSNGHQGSQGGHRGGRPSRGGFQDRKPIQRPDKVAPTVAVN